VIAGFYFLLFEEKKKRGKEKKIMSDVLCFLETLDKSSSLYNAIERSMSIIDSALHLYSCPQEVAFSFNGGKDCTVVLHLIRGCLQRRGSQAFPSVLYFSSSGEDLKKTNASLVFPEVVLFIKYCEAAFKFKVNELKGFKEGLASLVAPKGSLRGVLMGTRVGDPDARQLMGPFTPTSTSWPPVMRVCPILEWNYGQVWQFLRGLKAPYCSLYDLGYTSLGSPTDCTPNPALVSGEKNGEIHEPAWKLEDGLLERMGRGRAPKVRDTQSL